MNNQFKKLITALKSIHLSERERDMMKNRIWEYIQHFPIKQYVPEKNHFSIKSPFLWRAVPVAIILITVFVGNVSNKSVLPSTDYFLRQQNNNFGVSDGPSESGIDSPHIETGTKTTETKNLSNFIAQEEALSDIFVPSAGSLSQNLSESTIEPVIPSYRYYDDSKPDISDTREFLKISYSADIKTRDVSDTVSQVGGLVQILDGRIDSVSTSEKYGYISFVIPKNNFFEFKTKIEEITHSNLYTENTSSQNLLRQKQNIEQRTDESTTILLDLRQDKRDLDRSYSKKITLINSQIITIQDQINDLRTELLTIPADDPNEDRIKSLLAVLATQVVSLQNQLTVENRDYTANNNALVSRINATDQALENLAKEDVYFANNIETVNGYINVQWVNLWRLVEAFSPTPMWVNVVILVLIAWWFIERKMKLRRL